MTWQTFDILFLLWKMYKVLVILFSEIKWKLNKQTILNLLANYISCLLLLSYIYAVYVSICSDCDFIQMFSIESKGNLSHVM